MNEPGRTVNYPAANYDEGEDEGIGEVIDLDGLLQDYDDGSPEGKDFDAMYKYETQLLQDISIVPQSSRDKGDSRNRPSHQRGEGDVVDPSSLLEAGPEELQTHLNTQQVRKSQDTGDGRTGQQGERGDASGIGRPEEASSFMGGLGASQIQHGRNGSNPDLGDGPYPSGHLVSDVDELHRLGIHAGQPLEQTDHPDPRQTQGEGVFSFGEASRLADAGSVLSSRNYSPEVQAILEENRKALELLKMGNHKDCLQILKMCEANLIRRMKEEQMNQRAHQKESSLSSNHASNNTLSMMLKLLAITLNNLACYCKKRNMFQMGLRYLARVLQIEKYSARGRSNGSALAATYLNIGAVLSSMSKSKESVKMASKATNILLNLKEERLLNGQDLTSGEKVNLVVGHYNLAVGAELGGHRNLAIEKASQGYQFAIMELGLAHPLTEDVGAYVQKLRQKVPQTNQNTSRIEEAQNRSNYRLEAKGSGDISQALNRPIAPPTASHLGKSDNLLRGHSSRYETSGYSREYSSKQGGRNASHLESGISNAKPRLESVEGLSRRAKAGTLQLDDAGQLNLVIRNNQVNVISTGLGFLEGLGDRPLKKVPKKKKQMLRPVQRPNPSDPYKLKLANPLGSKSRSQSTQNNQGKRTPHETATAREAQLRSLLDDMLNTKLRGKSERIYYEGRSSNNQSSYSRSKSLINRGEDSVLDPNSLIQGARRDSVNQHNSNLKLKIWTNKEKPIELDHSGYNRTFGSSTPFQQGSGEHAPRGSQQNSNTNAPDRLPSLRESHRNTLNNLPAPRRPSRQTSEQSERERPALPRPNIPRPPPRNTSRPTSEDTRHVPDLPKPHQTTNTMSEHYEHPHSHQNMPKTHENTLRSLQNPQNTQNHRNSYKTPQNAQISHQNTKNSAENTYNNTENDQNTENDEDNEHVTKLEKELAELRQKVRMYEDQDRPKFMVTSGEKVPANPGVGASGVYLTTDVRKNSPPKERSAGILENPKFGGVSEKKGEVGENRLKPQTQEAKRGPSDHTGQRSQGQPENNGKEQKATGLKVVKDAQGRALPVLEASQKELIRQMLSKEVEDGDIEILHPLHSEELSKSDETRRSKISDPKSIPIPQKPAVGTSKLAHFMKNTNSRILEDPHEDSETVTPINKDDWIYVQEKSSQKIEPALDNKEIKKTNDTRFGRDQPHANLSQTQSVLGTNPLMRTSMLSQYGLNTTLSGGFGMKKVVAYNLKYNVSSDSENPDSRS